MPPKKEEFGCIQCPAEAGRCGERCAHFERLSKKPKSADTRPTVVHSLIHSDGTYTRQDYEAQ